MDSNAQEPSDPSSSLGVANPDVQELDSSSPKVGDAPLSNEDDFNSTIDGADKLSKEKLHASRSFRQEQAEHDGDSVLLPQEEKSGSIHPSTRLTPIFPATSLASPNRYNKPIEFRIPQNCFDKHFQVEHLLYLNPHLVRKYILENMNVFDDLVEVLQTAMRRCIRKGSICNAEWEDSMKSILLTANYFTFQQPASRLTNSTASTPGTTSTGEKRNTEPTQLTLSVFVKEVNTQLGITSLVNSGTFHYFFSFYMRLINWFNKEREEAKNGEMREIFEELVACKEMKRAYFEYFKRIRSNINAKAALEAPLEKSLDTNLVAKIQGALLVSKHLYLFNLYSEVESQFFKELSITSFFLEDFQQDAFFYHAFVREENPLEIIRQEALTAVRENDLEWLKVITAPSVFAPLRSIIFIEAVELSHYNVDNLRVIHTILFENSHSSDTKPSPNTTEDESLDQLCKYLHYLIEVAHWSQQFVQTLGVEGLNKTIFREIYNASLEGLDPSSIGSLVMKKLMTSSPLYALAPWINDSSPEDMLHWISTHPHESETSKAQQRDTLYYFKAMGALTSFLTSKSSFSNYLEYVGELSPDVKLKTIRDTLQVIVNPSNWESGKNVRAELIAVLQSLSTLCIGIESGAHGEQEVMNCEANMNDDQNSVQMLLTNLRSTIQDLLWRLEEKNYDLFGQSNDSLFDYLFESPEKLILQSLQDNNLEKAELIFEQYKSIISEKQKNEFLTARILHETEKQGAIPQNENHLLASFFVINDREAILDKIQKMHPDKVWISKLSNASKQGISPEAAVEIFFSLYYLLPTNVEMDTFFSANQFVKETVGLLLRSNALTLETLDQLQASLSTTLKNAGCLPKMLEYLSHIINLSGKTLDLGFVNQRPEDLIMSLVEKGDVKTANSLSMYYAIDLLSIILMSETKTAFSPEVLSYFDSSSKVLGLFLRVFLLEKSNQKQWCELHVYCKENFPHALPWIQYIRNESASSALEQVETEGDVDVTKQEDGLSSLESLYKSSLSQSLLLKDFDAKSPKVTLSLLFQIPDIFVAFEHFKRYLHEWKMDECIEVLRFFFCTLYSLLSKNRLRSRIKTNPILLEVASMLRRVLLVKKVSSAISEEWSVLYQVLLSRPNVLVENLVVKKRFELAQEVLELCDNLIDTQLRHVVRARHTMNILANSDKTQCMQFLEQFSASESLKISEIALQESKEFEVQYFFCQYINSVLLSTLDEEKRTFYKNNFNTLKALSLIDRSHYEVFYSRLKDKPELIVENLLMQAQIDDVAKILKELPELQNDSLLITHALKALSVENQPDEPWQVRYVWGVDERHDKRIRRWHAFSQAPSIILTKKILSLVNGAGRAGESLLNLALDISKLPAHHFPSRYEQMQLVDDILGLSKTCFLKDPDGHEFLPTYDTLKNRLELLKEIYNADPNIKIFLPDLSKQSKARRVRDSLMEVDQMELALELATKCHVEREPVWIEWGISLLSLGMYSEAREKLRQCGSLIPTQKQQLLERIIEAIRSPSTTKHKSLLQNHNSILKHQKDLREELQQLKNQNPESIVNLSRHIPLLSSTLFATRVDDQGCNEVRFYCELLGTPKDYLEFLIQQGSFVEAVSHTITNQISQTVFVKAVIVYCHRHGLLHKLYDTIASSSLSSQANLLKPYWTAACKYFDQKETLHLLYDLQAFMKDEARCGLTCIRLYRENFMDSGPLLLAKNHFSKALQLTATIAKSVLSPEEIANYMQSTNFQLELFQYPTVLAAVSEEKLDLFGSERKKIKIVKLLFNHSPNFAIRLINAYELPSVKLYIGILRDLAMKKSYDTIEQLLKKLLLTLRQEDKDVILEALIYALSQELQDDRTAKKYIPKLTSDTIITRAWLHCHSYKKAFLAATRQGSPTQMQDVQMVARHLDKLPGCGGKIGVAVKKQCDDWLQNAGLKIPSTPVKQ